MFERFTDRARRVVVLAQEEARLMPHHYAGTEHLLLGMLREGEAVAALALGDLGVTLEAAREQVIVIRPPEAAEWTGNLSFTPRLKKVLELSLREALCLGHNYIGTEHLLLGLIREGEGVAARALRELGHEPEAVRQAVMTRLGSYERAEDRAGPAGTLTCRREPSASEVLAAARAVAERLADLDGYIGRRAAELAAPAIAEARQAEAEIERIYEAGDTRVADLQQEFGRQRAVLERRIVKLESANARLRDAAREAGSG